MRAALYARYSSDRQNERSIADQLGVLTRHAADKGWTVAHVFTDAAISGSAMANRPGLLNALEAAGRGEYDLLLAEDEDRIARNLEHLAHVANRLADVGAAIATLSTDRVQDMHVAFKGLIAQDYIRNLSQKTKRGMASNAEKGLATGSRLYGYRSQPGGAIEIVPDQAQVIRRIFTLYADDAVPARRIAAILNAEGVPAPRGGVWNGSTIQGSAQRANGILHTELYAGVKVFGRVRMRRDRQTGRRITECLPADQHRRVPVPHLAIIGRDLWDRAVARRTQNTVGAAAGSARPARRPYLLSGLIRCGQCGAGYTAQGGNRLACAAYREKGPAVCTNRRHVNRLEVERRVLSGLKERLLSPEAVAAYVRAYHAAWAERAAEQRSARAPLEKRLAVVERAIKRGVDAIFDGSADARAVGDRLKALEAEQVQIRAALDQVEADGPPPVQLHPRAADAYRAKVTELESHLSGAEPGREPDPALIRALRELIDGIEVHPEGDEIRAPYRLVMHGEMNRLIRPAEAPHVGGPMVAGGGIEPPTYGL